MKTELNAGNSIHYHVMDELKEYPRKHFLDIATSIAELLCKKNIDYGDSFHDAYKEFGDISVAIRLSDKINRLTTLVKNGEENARINESIEDVLWDIAGYAILALSSKRRLQGGEQ